MWGVAIYYPTKISIDTLNTEVDVINEIAMEDRDDCGLKMGKMKVLQMKIEIFTDLWTKRLLFILRQTSL